MIQTCVKPCIQKLICQNLAIGIYLFVYLFSIFICVERTHFTADGSIRSCRAEYVHLSRSPVITNITVIHEYMPLKTYCRWATTMSIKKIYISRETLTIDFIFIKQSNTGSWYNSIILYVSYFKVIFNKTLNTYFKIIIF